MSAFPGVWALRLSASRNGWMESIKISSAGITVFTLKTSGIAVKRSTTSIMNMIWQYWISSFCRRHRAKELLHMLSAMFWLRKRVLTPIQTTRKHGNSMKNLGSSVSQDQRFTRRDQRIWRSLGIRSKAPAQQNQHEESGRGYWPQERSLN